MILNRQRRVRVSVTALEKFLARARRSLRLPGESFSVCLVTDAEMARWNRAHRGKKGPTDVLSFATDGKPRGRAKFFARNGQRCFQLSADEHSASYIGDIAIAPAVARRNARQLGRTLEDELRILLLHGMLHLMGYDHETDTGQMERRERRLRRALGLA